MFAISPIPDRLKFCLFSIKNKTPIRKNFLRSAPEEKKEFETKGFQLYSTKANEVLVQQSFFQHLESLMNLSGQLFFSFQFIFLLVVGNEERNDRSVRENRGLGFENDRLVCFGV